MPIAGVTDQSAAYPRLGLLRKGGPKRMVPSKKDPKKLVEVAGEDLDHFRFVSDNPVAVKCFLENYGPEPRVINVRLPYARRQENLDAWMKQHGAGSLKVKCNRRKDEPGIVLWQDDKGKFHSDPKPCLWPDCQCKPSGILSVIIPELVQKAGIGTVWVVTTSWNDCIELDRNLAAAEDSAHRLGLDLRGIPFILTRRLQDVSGPAYEGTGGKRTKTERWMLHIEPRPDWVAEQLMAFERLASPTTVTPALLTAPDVPQPSAFDEDFSEEQDYPEPDDIRDGEFEVATENEPHPQATGAGVERTENPTGINSPTALLKRANPKGFNSAVSLLEYFKTELTWKSWPPANDVEAWQAAVAKIDALPPTEVK